MATLLGTYYGNSTGPTYCKFRVVVQYQVTQTDPVKGYYLQRRYYVQVTQGQSSNFTNNLTVSWSSTKYALSTAGNYAVQSWQNVGWVGYGEKTSYSCYAYYQPYSGSAYKTTAEGSYTVPKPTYTVKYNGNGGTNIPDNQTKTYGTDLTLSSKIPVFDGHKFLGWGTSSSDTSVDYLPGERYSSNASITLYAIWKENNLISKNENGQIRKGRPWMNGRTGTPWMNIDGTWRKGGS